MIHLLDHRGPDGLGVHEQAGGGLAHARLSIIDPAGGAQPMGTADGSAWITYNGEIFNHVELRESLRARGHRFTTRSDTEVLLRLYLEEGEGCVQRLNGQWAFAVWEPLRGRLFLSRDRYGERPLFYTRTRDLFAFASEIKALLGVPGVPRRPDLRALQQACTFWSAVAPRTFFEGISELPPGCSLLLLGGRGEVRRHFQIGYAPLPGFPSEDALAARLRDTLEEATRLRLLRSDVPVGGYLSGGLDSAVVMGLGGRASSAPIETFSITFEDAGFDEAAHQAEVVRHLGVRHRSLPCRAEDIGRVFPAVVWHAEAPLLRTAPAPMFLLSRFVREHGLRVVLTGEGADEVLGGYDIFKEAKIRRFWAGHPGSRQRGQLLRRLYPYLPRLSGQPDALLQAFFRPRPETLGDPFYSHLPRWETTSMLKALFSDDVRSALRGYDPVAELRGELPPEMSSWPPFCQAQYLEARLLLPGYILSSQGDRMAMAHGVEARHPFLDPQVAQIAAALPPRLKMRVLDEKYLLKRAAAGLYPDFLRRRPKQPYRAPDAASFFDAETGQARFPYVDHLLSRPEIERHGIFRPEAVEALIARAKRGRSAGARDGMGLVLVLSTQLLMERFVRSPGMKGGALP
jgi:asparagine synthase (glutamine-hydrolysing)